jgi:galactosamine-6-phosphate isomerase
LSSIRWICSDSHADYVQAAVTILINTLQAKNEAFFTLATGASPADIYDAWVKDIKEKQLTTAHMVIHALDEWVGLPKGHPGTCDAFLRRHVVTPLGIAPERYHALCGTSDPAQEVQRMKTLLSCAGYADLCVLGIGKNGHLGLNEPGQVVYPYTHVASLTETSQGHQMLNGSDVTTGMTTGIAEILAAKEILVLVSGAGKDIKRLLEPEVSTAFPASFIHLHRNVTVVVDEPYSHVCRKILGERNDG